MWEKLMEKARHFLTAWRLQAARGTHAFQLANLLAAEAAQRLSLARRLALLDVLQSAQQPLLAPQLMAQVEARIGSGCWGGSPQRTLHDDVRRLKMAGFQIRYRRGGAAGYIWGGPHGVVDTEAVRGRIEPAETEYVEALASLTPQAKLARAEEMARWAAALQAQTREATR